MTRMVVKSKVNREENWIKAILFPNPVIVYSSLLWLNSKKGMFFFCLRSGPVSKCWPFSLLITLLIVNFVVIVLVLKKYWSFKYRATIYFFLNAVFTQTLSRRVDWFWGFFLRGWAAPCCFNSRGWRSGVVSEKDPEENWLGLWRSCCKILDAFCRFSLEQGI